MCDRGERHAAMAGLYELPIGAAGARVTERSALCARRLLVLVAVPVRLENAPDLVCELLWRERFTDELGFAIEDAVVNDRLVGVAGHEQHPCSRTSLDEYLRQLAAANSRHDDVRDEQIDRPIKSAGERESLVPARGFEHLVAKVAQDTSDELSHHLFVFDEKQRLRTPSLSERGNHSFHFGALLGDRKVDAKNAALAHLARDLDRAARLLHDAVYCR